MKYYTNQFLQSASFYDIFYLPAISLEEYIVRENFNRKIGTHEEAIEIVNNDYITHCKYFFKKNIVFYDVLSKYILNINGEFKRLDEYNFFKLRYYGTKFLGVLNEYRNFFEEERKKFKENGYPAAIITLSRFKFHDANAIFEYTGHILQVTYNPGCFEEIFRFYGVKSWKKYEFMMKAPILIAEELFEEKRGTFVYNTLWYHEDINGKNHSELSIKFTNLVQVK
ncbi:hypothetical protein [Robinsoniella peoriensis]|uniref:hypothetical protein n=1 Tax=Robinsoniella peoriensis TaxID=180332 RepID=UPI00363A07AB